MIKIENLKKSYKSFSLNCSLDIHSGSITGLIGQNGAGKSTAFKSILGLIAPDSGNISIFGKNIRDFTPHDKENIGVVLSDSGFSGYLTVNDVIPILEKLYRQFDKSFFIDLTDRFGLPRDKKIKELSTGMKAKLKVLTAVTHNAKLLILDEPTSGLDVIARDEILGMLRDYMESDSERSILISSHISGDLETLCDDVYLIHEGRIIMHEDTDVLLGSYALIKADPEQYAKLDKEYILRVREEKYGYSCLTNQRLYYSENYPAIAIEKGSIDGVMTMMLRGKKL